jgi:hypothetical protein
MGRFSVKAPFIHTDRGDLFPNILPVTDLTIFHVILILFLEFVISPS